MPSLMGTWELLLCSHWNWALSELFSSGARGICGIVRGENERAFSFLTLCHEIFQSTLMSHFAKKISTKQSSMGPSLKQKICCGVGLNLCGMSKTTRAMVFHLRHSVILSSLVPEYGNETCFAPSTSRDFAVTCVARPELHCWTQVKMRAEWAPPALNTMVWSWEARKRLSIDVGNWQSDNVFPFCFTWMCCFCWVSAEWWVMMRLHFSWLPHDVLT